jgi:hypothetical protein
VHCDFQYAADAVRAAGFDPTFPNPPFADLNMSTDAKLALKALPFDGTFYLAIDIAYRISTGTPENCMNTQQIGTDANGFPILVCVAWSVPFILKVSSYVLIWEPEQQAPPKGWSSSHYPAALRTVQHLAAHSGKRRNKKHTGAAAVFRRHG